MLDGVAFIFDIDGTLTPSRSPMDWEFQQKFIRFQSDHKTYLVTGSDFDKTLNQVGFQIIFSATKTFHCCGNERRHQGKLMHKRNWRPTEEQKLFLQQCLDESGFPLRHRTTKFIECRNGSINFSVLGRAANKEQRQVYIEYDKKYSERFHLAEKIQTRFPDLTVQIGGETGLDIMPYGYDKRQIIHHIPETTLVFFGDAIFPMGNDNTLAEAIKNSGRKHDIFPVHSWKETESILDAIIDNDTIEFGE